MQRWAIGRHGGLVANGTNEAPGSDGYMLGGECIEHCISGECWFPKVQAQPLILLYNEGTKYIGSSRCRRGRTRRIRAPLGCATGPR